jgi:luciferase-like monooxygenase
MGRSDHAGMSRGRPSPAIAERYDRSVSRASAFVDEIANELGSWPGVRIERHQRSPTVVYYEDLELGVLDRERGVAELRFSYPERDALVEHGDAEPASPIRDAENVSHAVHGPADITAVLELFDRRYRDLRGEGESYSSQDPS